MTAFVKKVSQQQPKPLSFVQAVKAGGDHWKSELHRTKWAGWLETWTPDQHDAYRMDACERGLSDRAWIGAAFLTPFEGVTPAIVTEFVYPPIPERSMDWSAVREDYDGAPDSHPSQRRIGHGRTKFEAIADLLEQEGA